MSTAKASLSFGFEVDSAESPPFSFQAVRLMYPKKGREPMPKPRPRVLPPGGAAQPKYTISTAAELTGVPPQQLRRFEQAGLLTPARSSGGARRYSDADLDQVARIRDLSDAGVNEAGIAQILALQSALCASEARTAEALRRAEVAEGRHMEATAKRKTPRRQGLPQ